MGWSLSEARYTPSLLSIYFGPPDQSTAAPPSFRGIAQDQIGSSESSLSNFSPASPRPTRSGERTSIVELVRCSASMPVFELQKRHLHTRTYHHHCINLTASSAVFRSLLPAAPNTLHARGITAVPRSLLCVSLSPVQVAASLPVRSLPSRLPRGYTIIYLSLQSGASG